MKELSVEEKARRYDEAVNEIRNLRDILLKEGVINKNGIICDNFNRIFPELSESEDERIRKEIIDFATKANNGVTSILANNYDFNRWLAWLEKQDDKTAWSEDDENNILFLTSIIEECFKDKEKITLYGDTACANFTKDDVIDRLKSLIPKPQWKPSDEQMEVLTAISSKEILSGYERGMLVGLYTELQKLREE